MGGVRSSPRLRGLTVSRPWQCTVQLQEQRERKTTRETPPDRCHNNRTWVVAVMNANTVDALCPIPT